MAGRLVAGLLARGQANDEGLASWQRQALRGGSCRGPGWPWRWGEAGVGELAGVVAPGFPPLAVGAVEMYV